MSVIDEKGKLGGKINIIDLIVILVVLAAVAAVFVLGGRGGGKSLGVHPREVSWAGSPPQKKKAIKPLGFLGLQWAIVEKPTAFC